MEEQDDYYCNESTYSNLSVLFVTGLLRLDDSIGALSTAATLPEGTEFDAWPASDHWNDVKHAMRKHFNGMGLGDTVNLPDY